MEEAERRTEAAAVDEFHHRKQLLQFVLERRSAEHESITAFQLFYGAGGGGGPVPNALRRGSDPSMTCAERSVNFSISVFHHPASGGGKNGALRLVGQQFGLEHSIQWVLSTAKFPEQLPFPLQSFRNLVLAIHILENVAVDHRILIRIAKHLQHPIKTGEVFSAQQSC